MTGLDVVVQTHDFLHGAGAGGAFVALEADEGDFGIGVDVKEKLCCKGECAVKHTYQQRPAAAVLLGDFAGKLEDAGLYFLSLNEWLKSEPVIADLFHRAKLVGAKL